MAEPLGHTSGSFIYRLMIVNILLGGFNLLPAFPMDGGRILRATLAFRMSHLEATRWAASVGQFIAVGLGMLGIMYNPFLLFIAVFVWFGASIESNTEKIKSVLDHASVRHAMLKDFQTLSPEDTLSRAVELTLSGSQKDFPVGYRDNLFKVLHYSDLIKGLQEKGEHARIADLPLQDIRRVDINEPLGNLMEIMKDDLTQVFSVIENDRIVGLLDHCRRCS